jgi:hypothetical protein
MTKFDEKIIAEIEKRIEGLEPKDAHRELLSLVNLYSCIYVLCTTFNEIECLEQYGNYMRLRVQRLDKSIGCVFGLIEPLKAIHNVCSYSVS